jgi:hypothetical protein
MFQALQVAALLLVAMAWALVFAHAAELPGKMRLDRETYFAVQPIYYPGFTIAGASEPLSIIALAALLAFTTPASSAFPWTAGALAGAITNHIVYWLRTHPVNNFWLKDQALKGASAKFFEAGTSATEASWSQLRNRWEYSHVLRAVLMSVVLIALAVAATLPRAG